MLKASLPFRHDDEKTFLSKVHPIVRLFLPFIFVIPFLLIDSVYLIMTMILITLIFSLFARLNLIRIFSRIKSIAPFIFLITVFIPLYVGETVAYTINIGFSIIIYKEGLARAFLLFMRIFGSAFIFMTFFSAFTYSEFVEALTNLHLPAWFVGSFIIMLHYIPIIASSNRVILDAQEIRGKKMTTYWERLKAHAYIMGKSLVSNMERSEHLYDCLKMRGFTGNFTFISRKIKIIDILLLALFLVISFSFIFLINLQLLYTQVLTLFIL